jgi:hypothetical protein
VKPHLELVDVTREEPTEETPHPGGAVSWNQLSFINLVRGDEVICIVSACGVDRIGVGVYKAGRHVSYRECSPVEAAEMTLGLQLVGFKKAG